jgi:hypothetical protein
LYLEDRFVSFFTNILLMYQWVSPFVVVDQDANAIYGAAAKALFGPGVARFGVNPVRGISSTLLRTGDSFRLVLDDFRRSSRGL